MHPATSFAHEIAASAPPGPSGLDFELSSIHEVAAAPSAALDAASFGTIGFGADGIVDVYSAVEARMAGLSPERVKGKHLFTTVAPCMNNFMIAHRFENEGEIDAVVDYVLTLRMRPTPVKIRLLKSASAARRFLLIRR